MNWKKTRERTSELLLVIGLVIIVTGFIDLLKMSGWQLVTSGVIITGIGTHEILKKMRKKK